MPNPPPSEYAPPKAEDIDTTVEPSETVAGAGGSIGQLGAEESNRWH